MFLIAVGAGVLTWRQTTIPQFTEFVRHQRGSEFLLFDRGGRELSRFRQNKNVRHLPWVELSAVSPVFVEKLTQAEDKRFYAHAGVDVYGVFSSLAGWLRGRPLRGASTLSMQAGRLVLPFAHRRGLADKFQQMITAWKLERAWTKKQILEVYVNLVDFRGEYRGLRTAAQAFFDKNPSGLDEAESSLLVAMIRSPNAAFEQIARRACALSAPACPQIREQVARLQQIKPSIPASRDESPHLARWVWNRLSPAERARGVFESSVDGQLQEFANQALRTQISALTEQNVHDGAILVLDNKTGEVLAYVGSSGELSSAAAIDGVQAKRQVGSTLKPFLYGTAFEKKILGPDSWLEDSPVEIVFPNGVYRPQNHDKNFHGWVRARSALASSLNVPAVKVVKMLGDDSFWQTLSRLHLENLKDADLYGPALALGVADLSLWDLTNAYRALANDGQWTPARWQVHSVEAPAERIFSDATARTLREILSSAQDRQLGFGYETSLANRFPAAVKTGTSKDMRDNWCFGFSKDYTVGVWVGNFDGQPMWNVLGVTGAAPLWSKILTWLHENRRSQAGEESLAQATPGARTAPVKYPIAKIAYPLSGLNIAIDPDIPLPNQKMPVMAEGEVSRGVNWFIDGKYWRPAQQDQTWNLEKGRHRFELKRGAVVLDATEITVR